MEQNLDCQLTHGSTSTGIVYYDDNNVWHPWDWDYYQGYYYQPISCQIVVEDKVSKSFKIVSKLLEKKIIVKISIKEFIELVTEISAIL